MDAELNKYANIDWNSAIDADFTNAMKLQEQRNSLKNMRDAKLNELNGKKQQFDQGQAQATQQLLASEASALLSRVPEWRNADKAQQEKSGINTYLQGKGFQPAELNGLMDHRMVEVAREAYLYRQLMAGKEGKIRQVRDAPNTVTPGGTVPNSGKANFAKATRQVRQFGREGKPKAQEALVAEMFNRAFK